MSASRFLLPASAVAILAACSTRSAPESTSDLLVELIPLDARSVRPELHRITRSDYRLALARMRLEREESLRAGPLPQDLERLVLERLIEARLFEIEAARLGIRAPTSTVAKELAAMKAGYPPGQLEQILADTYQTEGDLARAIERRLEASLLLEREAFAPIEVSDQDLLHRWESMPEEKRVRAGRVRAAHIIVRTESEGRRAIAALKKGAEFAEVARQYSVAPGVDRGGDLGWFRRGDMPRALEDSCFHLRPGEISDLTPSEYGFHICKVLESEEARTLTLEEARPELRGALQEERRRQAETEYMAALRARFRIVRDDGKIRALTGARTGT